MHVVLLSGSPAARSRTEVLPDLCASVWARNEGLAWVRCTAASIAKPQEPEVASLQEMELNGIFRTKITLVITSK